MPLVQWGWVLQGDLVRSDRDKEESLLLCPSTDDPEETKYQARRWFFTSVLKSWAYLTAFKTSLNYWQNSYILGIIKSSQSIILNHSFIKYLLGTYNYIQRTGKVLRHKNLEYTVWLGALQKLNTAISKHSTGLRLSCSPVFTSEAEDRKVVKIKALEVDLGSSNPSYTIS